MNAFTALIAGLLAGWLIEWVIDWTLWRRRQAVLKKQLDRAYIKLGSADAASHALEHQLETLRIEHAALQTKYNSLAARIADTQPKTAAIKQDEETTWTDAAPAEEWVPETAARETPAEPDPSEPSEVSETLELPAEDFTASPTPQTEPPSAGTPSGPVDPIPPEAPAPTVEPEAVEPAPPASAAAIPAEPSIPGLPDGPAQGDNLRAIKGIGPAIDYKLHQAGINTYRDLAESSPERVADAIGMTFLRLVNVEALIEQARLLAANQNGGGQA